MPERPADHSPKTASCNKAFFKQLRESRGLTQSELAKLAGYTVRLVAKAEAGQSISVAAASDLAEALSTSEDPIFVEDLCCDPVALAQEYIAALYIHQRDIVAHIRHFLAEDILFRINGDPQQIPFAGDWHGIDEAHQAFQHFFSIIEVPPGHDHRPYYRYLAQGRDAVIWGQSWMHPIGQPMDQPMTLSILLRFRRGKMYYFEDQIDTQLATKVL